MSPIHVTVACDCAGLSLTSCALRTQGMADFQLLAAQPVYDGAWLHLLPGVPVRHDCGSRIQLGTLYLGVQIIRKQLLWTRVVSASQACRAR